MNTNTLTNRDTWERYWERYVPVEIERKCTFERLFEGIPNGELSKSFIEIGGFPGTFAIYFRKYKSYKVSLLDFYISNPIIEKLLSKNGLDSSDLTVIEADFLSFQSEDKFDLVFSAGLIEHFEDTADLIKRHYELVKINGRLLITLPNLRGLNGWVQKYFHRSNYDIHNLECMNVNLIKDICLCLGVQDVKVYYFGKPMIWLEESAPVSRTTKKLVKFISLFLKFFPLRGRLLSPYIVLEGTKK